MIVSGDAIEGTITPRLLKRARPGLMTDRLAHELPTIAEFAEAIAGAAADPDLPTGHTLFVGFTDY